MAETWPQLRWGCVCTELGLMWLCGQLPGLPSHWPILMCNPAPRVLCSTCRRPLLICSAAHCGNVVMWGPLIAPPHPITDSSILWATTELSAVVLVFLLILATASVSLSNSELFKCLNYIWILTVGAYQVINKRDLLLHPLQGSFILNSGPQCIISIL